VLIEFVEGQTATVCRTIDAHDLLVMERFADGIAVTAPQLVADALLGTAASRLPGDGAETISRHARFMSAAKAGDTLTATATVVAFEPTARLLTLRTFCTDQEGARIAEGQAILRAAQRESAS